MRVPISLVLSIVVLISGPFIGQSYAEAGELGEYELPNPGIVEKEIEGIERQTRDIETATESRNVEEETTTSARNRDNTQVLTDGINKKRHVSFTMSGLTDQPSDLVAVPRSAVVSAPSTPDVSPCGCGKSVFTSKITGCFTNIVAELKALMECAKLALINLKGEISLGPQKGECWDDNAAAANESLIMTHKEIQALVDRLPALVQVVLQEPQQLWSVGDVVSSSVPTTKISRSVSNLRDHILELLGIIKEWLCTNDKAMDKIQMIENHMASLHASKFDSLDVGLPSSSLTVSPAVSTRPPALTIRRDYVNWPDLRSPTAMIASPAYTTTTVKSDLGMAKKFQTIRSLCTFIRQVPILLIELTAVLKNSLLTIHENGGLCEKLRNHPLFLLPACGGLLPGREGTTVIAPESFSPDPQPSTPSSPSSGSLNYGLLLQGTAGTPGALSPSSNFRWPSNNPGSFNYEPMSQSVILTGSDTTPGSAQPPSNPTQQFSYSGSSNDGFQWPPAIPTGLSATGSASLPLDFRWPPVISTGLSATGSASLRPDSRWPFKYPASFPYGLTQSRPISTQPDRTGFASPPSNSQWLNVGFSSSPEIRTEPATPGYASLASHFTWPASLSGVSSYEDKRPAQSLAIADTAHPASPTCSDSSGLLNAAGSCISSKMEKLASLVPSYSKVSSLGVPSEVSVSMGSSIPSDLRASYARSSLDSELELKSPTLVPALTVDQRPNQGQLVVAPCVQEVIVSRSSAASPSDLREEQYHGNGCCLDGLLKKGCCPCKRKFQSSLSGNSYAPASQQSLNGVRVYRESAPRNDDHARTRRYISNYFLPSTDSPSAPGASSPKSITPSSSSGLPLFSQFLFKPKNILAGIFSSSASSSSANTDASSTNEKPSSVHVSSGPSSSRFTEASDSLVKPATYGFNGAVNDAGSSPAASSASGVSGTPYGGFDFNEDFNESVH